MEHREPPWKSLKQRIISALRGHFNLIAPNLHDWILAYFGTQQPGQQLTTAADTKERFIGLQYRFQVPPFSPKKRMPLILVS